MYTASYAYQRAKSRNVTQLLKSDITTLLFGVTSSGKTEVYASLIADAAKNGQAIYITVTGDSSYGTFY